MTQELPPPNLLTLSGVVDRVRPTKNLTDDNQWAVVSVELDDSRPGNTKFVTAVGDLAWARPGERIQMEGKWVNDPTYGRQFEVKEAHSNLPYTQDGIVRYLTHNGPKGTGQSLAAKIVDTFGPSTFEVIENNSEKLLEVKGIGKKTAEKLSNKIKEDIQNRRIEILLHNWKMSPSQIRKVRRFYGDNCAEVIQKNPYRLAHDVYSFGFKTADTIANEIGIRGSDPRRVQAGILYVLSEAQKEGHLYLPLELLLERASGYLAVDEDHIKGGIEALHHGGDLIHEPVPPEGELDGHLAVFSRRAWEAEVESAEQLQRLTSGVERPLDAATQEKIEEVQGELGITLAPAQVEAIRMAFGSRLLVITGGPGTGKTTLVRAVCRVAERMELSIALSAPTGRAARRMTEATGREAKTLHRLLEFSFQAGGFQRDEENPLEAELLVVDEASMIDVQLLRALVRAVPSSCRLVLVGDVDQLPSVGAGDVLADLIRSGAVPVCRLQTVFRQSELSAIVRNAHRVNQGLPPEQPAPSAPGERVDFYMIKADDPEQIAARVRKVVTERIPTAFGMDPMRDVQVIAPMHKGAVGCKTLNEALQEALNPGFGLEVTMGQRTFRAGDRVMQLRNNYDKEIFNGDVGAVLEVLTNDQGQPSGLRVDFDERVVEFERDELDELTLAYAVTAHKSQGSEYRAVVLPLATAHYVMLERNLLYTAITRARELVVLIYMPQALRRAVTNVSARARFTRLAARLARGATHNS